MSSSQTGSVLGKRNTREGESESTDQKSEVKNEDNEGSEGKNKRRKPDEPKSPKLHDEHPLRWLEEIEIDYPEMIPDNSSPTILEDTIRNLKSKKFICFQTGASTSDELLADKRFNLIIQNIPGLTQAGKTLEKLGKEEIAKFKTKLTEAKVILQFPIQDVKTFNNPKKKEVVFQVTVTGDYNTYTILGGGSIFNTQIQTQLSKVFDLDSSHIQIEAKPGSGLTMLFLIIIDLETILQSSSSGSEGGGGFRRVLGYIRFTKKKISLGTNGFTQGAKVGAGLGLLSGPVLGIGIPVGALFGGILGALGSGSLFSPPIEFEVGIGLWNDGTFRFTARII